MFCRVYGILFEGRVVYVGATTTTISNRKSSHLWHLRNRPENCPKLYSFMAEKDVSLFDFFLLEECSREELYERERFWISRHDTISNGLNSEPYCGGADNPVPGKGREKGCKNPSGSDHYAYGDSKATRKAVEASVKARLGKKLPESTRQKMRESRANNPLNSRAVKNLDTGVIYASMKEGAEASGVKKGSLWSALNRGTKCAGFNWQYV